MKELGFWDYTCPSHGSLERYTREDWDGLLDDMAAGGFNSLVLGIKWLTTGYRSKYAWLDQDLNATAIGSDNKLLHHAFEGARKRGIRPWILVVASIFDVEKFGIKPSTPNPPFLGSASYDLDQPGVAERIELLFEEVVDLFGKEAEGIVVELEFCDHEAPHRVGMYDAWAKKNGRPDFKTIKNIVLEPRHYPYHDWADYTTSRRVEMLGRIEKVVRGRGFKGPLSSIVELDNHPNGVLGNVNLQMLQAALPRWPVVTYDSIYDRRRHRKATMDFCVDTPKGLGLEVQYLTRGVMTFGLQPGMAPTTLEEQWRMSLEDALAHEPETLWFMGSDARLDGWVCSTVRLPEWGFGDGRSARKRLMQMAREMGVKAG